MAWRNFPGKDDGAEGFEREVVISESFHFTEDEAFVNMLSTRQPLQPS